MDKKILNYVIGIVVAIASVFTIVVTQDDSGTHVVIKPKTVLVKSANNKVVPVQPAKVAQAASGAEDHNLGGDATTIKQLQSSNKANPDAPVVSGPIPLASPFQPGCLTRSNTVNFSYRNGTKPSLVVLHLTVSPNTPGWSDVNGVWGFLNRASTQASANYIVDGEAHCIYAVSESLKSWNDSSYNSATACGIEVINTGSESVYIKSPGLAQLARIVHDCAHRWSIPLRPAITSGGAVQRAGVTDHYHLGSAGGGHVDIHNFGSHCLNQGPGANTSICIGVVIAAARALDTPAPIRPYLIRRCEAVYRLRPYSSLNKFQRARRQKYRASFKPHGVRCVHGKATRR